MKCIHGKEFHDFPKCFEEHDWTNNDKTMKQSEMASLGGKARAEKLSKARRLEISRKANEAKKKKRAKLISA